MRRWFDFGGKLPPLRFAGGKYLPRIAVALSRL